ncbi:ABC transporter related protein [Pseudonocardia dioxanivorans CB1190]|uniref:ABC transporter related protein n=1 Tax=Pseudonocardia dioxanivorans (strain ATCC 55486 / DSM 44775 / JCM 13855 / CB1190) TaxID=675635 RepID=F4CR58_PSEUX|nr:ABC transporter ATP-binding protein [Pseudonocardia dioxanivorans]AEA24495.1 ABC transporter related protein [Pseudonocardia dioxanivorans CB1190]
MSSAPRPTMPVLDDGLDLAVNLRDVVKRFGPVTALDHLTIRVRRGEAHGLVGPAGSGKTTALQILAGRLRPDRGSARVLATDPRRHAVELQRRVAYVPQQVYRWSHLTGAELLDTMSFLRGSDRTRRTELIERFDAATDRAGHLDSAENRQKIELIAALASRAELVVLDEPGRYLDAAARAELTAVLAEERGRRTLLLTEDPSAPAVPVASVCGQVTGLDAGRACDPDRRDAWGARGVRRVDDPWRRSARTF